MPTEVEPAALDFLDFRFRHVEVVQFLLLGLCIFGAHLFMLFLVQGSSRSVAVAVRTAQVPKFFRLT